MDTSTAGSTGPHTASARAADLVRWGPVVAGVVTGLGVFALLDALWFAIAAGDGNGWVTGNVDWWVGGTWIAALLIARSVAGLTCGARGAGASLGNGITAWGLLVVLSMLAGILGALGLSGALGLGPTAEQALWTLFWSLLTGAAAASSGGALGGAVRRPVVVADSQERDDGDPEVSRGCPAESGRRTRRATTSSTSSTTHWREAPRPPGRAAADPVACLTRSGSPAGPPR